MKLRVKNWKKFQHYKGRRPPWIKLHRDLLDDYEYSCLPLASRALAPCLWLIASDSQDGSLPEDAAKLAFRLRVTESDLAAALKPLIDSGFLEPADDAGATLAPSKQQSRPEESRDRVEAEQETEAEPPAAATEPALTVVSLSEEIRESREEWARAVWAAWCEKRGGGAAGSLRQMSPAEWDLLRQWLDRSVPLRIVLRGIKDCSAGKITAKTPLSYARPAVEEAITNWRTAMSGAA